MFTQVNCRCNCLGFDVVYSNAAPTETLTTRAQAEGHILLSKSDFSGKCFLQD